MKLTMEGRLPDPMVERVAIIGVGLIGGSLGMAWRRAGVVREVVGIDVNPRTLDEAIELEAIDRGTTELREGVKGAELVVLSTPVGVTISLGPELGRLLEPGTVVTDVGSTKLMVMKCMQENLPPAVSFVGGHPMTGSERSGVTAADPYLFENAIYVLTAFPYTSPSVVEKLETLVRSTGAQPVKMNPREHDLLVAAVSHLPQLAAVSLVSTVDELNAEHEKVLPLAAGGFRDTTRIAASQPEMWKDICLTNKDMIREMLSRFRSNLDKIEDMICRDAGEELHRQLLRAREVRESIPNRAKGLLPALHEIVVAARDRPGEIGNIATLLGSGGVNISDIEILRQREGEGGTIRLGFTNAAMVDQALAILRGAGFKARRR